MKIALAQMKTTADMEDNFQKSVRLAERAAAVHRCNAVCTGGFHVDNMTGAQIEELLAAVKELEI